MADKTVSFKMPDWMLTKIQSMAATDRRKLGAMVRVLLERQLIKEEADAMDDDTGATA